MLLPPRAAVPHPLLLPLLVLPAALSAPVLLAWGAALGFTAVAAAGGRRSAPGTA